MVSEGKCRLFKRKDGKYLIYVPKDLAEDSMFPWKDIESIRLSIKFRPGGSKQIIIEPLPPEAESEDPGP